jgi:hypothetical protein
MSLQRYSENPFVADMIVPVKNRSVKFSTMGGSDNVIVNQSTGEVQATHLTTYKKVDGAQFVKLFTANIALTFDLKSAGIKSFNVLMWTVQHNAITKDQVDLDSFMLEEFINSHNGGGKKLSLSLATFKRGLNELVKMQIIAMTLRKGRYYINPNFVFNGSRIAFTTVIERDKNKHPSQPELDLDSR